MKFFISEFFVLCYYSDDIEDMATFTILAKIYSINTKVASWLGEIFVQQKFSATRYMDAIIQNILQAQLCLCVVSPVAGCVLC